MSKVKRYDATATYGRGHMVVAKCGDFVRHSDYAALQARLADLETKLGEVATARRDALEDAVEVCTKIICDYDVMKPNGTTYEPVRVQRAAKGMVSLAREDIRALIAQEEQTT